MAAKKRRRGTSTARRAWCEMSSDKALQENGRKTGTKKAAKPATKQEKFTIKIWSRDSGSSGEFLEELSRRATKFHSTGNPTVMSSISKAVESFARILAVSHTFSVEYDVWCTEWPHEDRGHVRFEYRPSVMWLR